MDPSPLRVLLVEDDEDDYVLIRDLLAEVEGQRYELDWAPGYDTGLDRIAQGEHDVYLLDYRLGRYTGLDLLRAALERGCRTPLILLTGQGDREIDVEAMRSGAADYLAKGRMDSAQLERAIRFAVERKRIEDQLRRMRDELELRVHERTAELARANEELRRAKDAAEAANSAKDRFLAVLSHELRTPLNPVLVGISALLEDHETPAGLRPVLEVARRNVELEARLIDDLLDVTRIAQGKLTLSREIVDVHALVHRAADICRDDLKAAGLRLDITLDANEHYVDGDPARLQQIVWNLVKNAVKFTPRGGSITIRSRNRACDEAQPDLVIDVIDSGIGIAPESLDKIFRAFEQGGETITQRFGGLGLGLAISRSLAEAHGGRLTVRSEGVGRGATFTAELPTVPTPEPSTNGARPVLPRDQAVTDISILVVEDNEDTLGVLARLLRGLGHRACTANGFRTALDVEAREGPFDLVISDIGLPDGSGLDLMRCLRARGPIRGIALSGYGMDADVRKSADAGFTAHLVKPVDFNRLEEAIRHVAASGGQPCATRS